MYSVSPEIHTQFLQKPSESGVFTSHVGTDISKAIQIDPKHGSSHEDFLPNLFYEKELLNSKSTHTHTTGKCPFMDIDKNIPSKISANIIQQQLKE